ncbi:MAG: 50S ribosomal protein L13 [Firmicutes bacterium]|uniref:Large ribosomal subunit protein uL13 n=2 Tax=Geochorda subterranea TaxID=3109564 RepID=A0ABZ1BMS5_9FIRM|nr:50S ribosomal protein L13 [Limnochorda sp. LNt]NLG68999.1 50S ribosomal protein L13 [Bacillota bacterium]WRP14125.1 50S ribosomal protein L13 [Limnochorda sp. LNt]
MPVNPARTVMLRAQDVRPRWYVVDAQGKVLGRLASRIATVLRGKHKPSYTPHVDDGDYVVVVNADKVRVTGKKLDQKVYRHHTLHPGGLKTEPLRKLLARRPQEVLRRAVWGMLPHNPMGRRQIKKLKIYAGPEHPHQAQKPEPLDV